MRAAHRGQKFQDWFTQQWAIVWGRKVVPDKDTWLMGPYGETGGIGDSFICRLAAEEGLVVERNCVSRGLITPFSKLNLQAKGAACISQAVIDFYENTAQYDLKLSVRWSPVFKVFGRLVNILFSQRIRQLNIPLNNTDGTDRVKSEIITLTDPKSGEVKYTVWYRTIEETGEVVYSGIYSTCVLPSGETCVKAVFPLPKGNATVILLPVAGLTDRFSL